VRGTPHIVGGYGRGASEKKYEKKKSKPRRPTEDETIAVGVGLLRDGELRKTTSGDGLRLIRNDYDSDKA